MSLIHGGDVEGYKREYGHSPLDFSANISPLGLPDGVKKSDYFGFGGSRSLSGPTLS